MVRLLRNQGMETRYANEVVGFNTRMTDLHAAIGRVQLGKLAGWTAQRQANAAFLTAHLEGVVTPSVAEGAVHVYHQYTIRVPGHDRTPLSPPWPSAASDLVSTTQRPSTTYRRSGSRWTCLRQQRPPER